MWYWDGEQTLPMVALSTLQPHCVEISLSLDYRKNPARSQNCDSGWVSYLIIAWAVNSSHKTVMKHRPDSFTLKNKVSGIKMWVWNRKAMKYILLKVEKKSK